MKTYHLPLYVFLFLSYNLYAQNVGINTTTPLEKLDIRNGQIRMARTASYDNSILFSMPQSQLAGEHEGLKFQILGVDKAFIGYTSTSTSGNFLRMSGAGVYNNDLVIDAAGNIGMGLNTPSEKLHIAGNVLMNATNPTLQLQNAGVNKGYLQLSGDNIRIGTNSGNAAGKFIIRNNGGDRVYVDDAGNMGIGVADPAAQLHINSGASIEALRLTGNGGTIIRMMTGTTDKANIYATGNDLNITTVQSNGLLRLNGEVYINNTANGTGIGTSTPTEKLHVLGNIKVSTGKLLNNDNVNMMPVAYARFNTNGTKISGTSNIVCFNPHNSPPVNFFVIQMPGYDISKAVFQITAIGLNGCTASTFPISGYTDRVSLYFHNHILDDFTLPTFSICVWLQ